MSWAGRDAKTYRAVGTAESVIFTTAAGVARTCVDCQVVGRIERRVEDNAAVALGTSTTIYVPRTASNPTAPAAGEFAAPQTSGGTYTVRAVAPRPGHWEVGASQ